MLSRVASHLYWMSRYVERAEHAARLLDVNLTLMLDEDAEDTGRRWKRLLAALAAANEFKALASKPEPAGTLEPRELLRRLVFDRESQHSIMWTLGLARDNARQVRAQLPSEMWEQINSMHLNLGNDSIEDAWRAQPHDYFRATREGLHLWDGITFATMRRDEGWDWLQAGRFMERAGQTAALLEAYAGELQPGERPITTRDELDWVGLLKSRTAFEAYCQVYTADVRPEWVVAFLVFNEDFPQSARFAAGRVFAALEFDRRGRRCARPRQARAAVRAAARTAGLRHRRRSTGGRLRRLFTRSSKATRTAAQPDQPGVFSTADRGCAVKLYTIRHITHFRYSTPVHESVNEVYMQPRTDGPQHCLSFELVTNPRARPTSNRDYYGNISHHFDILASHSELTIRTTAVVSTEAAPPTATLGFGGVGRARSACAIRATRSRC